MAIQTDHQNAKPVFRVHVAGLSHVEQAVLGGLLHLAEAQGVRFKMEPQADSAHLFVLDARHPSGPELSRSIAQFERRVIWVDRPAGRHAGRAIPRPLQWRALLELLVRAGREYNQPARRRPVAMIGFGRLCSLCEMILRGHYGAAAEAMVTRARTELKTRAGADQPVGTNVFLEMLMRQLPQQAKAGNIRREIDAGIAREGWRAPRARLQSAS